MKIIALLAVMAVLAIEFSGAIPKSSVGGPLTYMLIYLIAMLAAGLYEAWSNRRGVLGWIGSIVAAIVGGFIGAGLGSMIMEMILPHLHLEGSLAATRHPMLYVAAAGMMMLTLLGSWVMLQIVNRFR